MNSPLILNGYSQNEGAVKSFPFDLPEPLEKSLQKYPELFQKPGERYALRYMRSFCESRGINYSRHISKPKESRKSCGRISPYLAWGNLSVRQAVQFVRNHPNYDSNKRSFQTISLDSNGAVILYKSLRWSAHMKHIVSIVVMKPWNMKVTLHSLKLGKKDKQVFHWWMLVCAV